MYGEAAAAATHNVAFVRQCFPKISILPKISQTLPKKAAINHIARVCGEKKSRCIFPQRLLN